MVKFPNEIFRDFQTDGVPSSEEHKPVKADIRDYLNNRDGLIEAGAIADLPTSLTVAALPSSGISEGDIYWVTSDPNVTLNGFYRRTSGAWVRVAGGPQDAVIYATRTGGTANALLATLPAVGGSGVLIMLPVTTANTASPVTVSFNGAAAIPVKTSGGSDVASGGLTVGLWAGHILPDGSAFRLISDQASLSIVAAAQAAAQAASAFDGNGLWSNTATTLLADAGFTYTAAQPGTVTAGQYIRTRAEGFSYQVAASGATDHDVTTAGGVKLYAVPTNGRLLPEQFGAVADWNGTTGTDNADAFAAIFAAHSRTKSSIYFDGGKTYFTSSSIVTNEDWVNVDGDFTCKIVTDATTGTILSIGASRAVVSTKTVTANITIGSKIITVASTAGLAAGMICHLQSTKAWYNDPRTDADISVGGFSLTQSGGLSSVILAAGFTVANDDLVGKAITFLSGVNSGFSRIVTSYDAVTKAAFFAPALPSVNGAGVTYRFPQAFKGQTHKIARIINGTTFETEDSNRDGYHVQDGTAANVKEVVTLTFYEAYSPRVKGVIFEGPAVSANNFGVSVRTADNPDIDIKTINCRRGGLVGSYGYGGNFRNQPSGSSDTSTGYGIQVSSWGGSPKLVGRGFGNRRVIDVSGITPTDDARIDAVCVGGGLQEDGSAYWPIGSVSNYGVGTHGAARGTIYESVIVSDCEHAIFERGRNATVKNLVIGPNVRVPVYHSFGGPIEVSGVTVDGRLFNANDLTGLIESSDFAGDAGDVYPDCLLMLGANLCATQPESRIVVRNNEVRAKKNLIQFENTGSATFTNIVAEGNNVEFYPDSNSDNTALFGKATDAAASTISIRGDILGPNNLRSADGGKMPVLYGPEITISESVGTFRQFGPGVFSIRLADDTVGVLPLPQKLATRLFVKVVVEESTTFFFDGAITANSTTSVEFASALTQVLAAAPTGISGTDGRLQLHFTPGALTIGNRCGGTRTFNIVVHGVG
jgi:hypothetical protein